MRVTPILTVLTLALALSGAPALAQGPMPAGLSRATALIDRDVYSSDGVEIGEIEDLLFDSDGRVVSAVVEIENSLGFTAKYVIVPYGQLRAADRRVTVAMTREELRALPGVDYRN